MRPSRGWFPDGRAGSTAAVRGGAPRGARVSVALVAPEPAAPELAATDGPPPTGRGANPGTDDQGTDPR